MIAQILQNQVFKGLSEKDLTELLEKTDYLHRKYKKDEIVVHAGEKVAVLYIVVKGSVRGEITNAEGKVVKIDDLGQSDDLAIGFVFADNNMFPVTVFANEESELIGFSRETIFKLMKENDTILNNFLTSISNRVDFLIKKVKFLHFPSIEAKLAMFFLEHKADEFYLQKTHQQLADFFGVSRPSLSRAISGMNKNGLIESKGKEVKILDKPGLQKILIKS